MSQNNYNDLEESSNILPTQNTKISTENEALKFGITAHKREVSDLMFTMELYREEKTLPNANSQLSRDEKLTENGENGKNKDLHEPNSLTRLPKIREY